MKQMLHKSKSFTTFGPIVQLNTKTMTTITKKIGGTTYNKCMTLFGKQFKNVKQMTKAYVNSDSRIFAGEWIDENGVINFNSGYAPDVDKVIEFK